MEKLRTCDERLQELFLKVSQVYPCQVIEGFRNEERQNVAVQMGYSKDPWPTSKHNQQPSKAIDVVPLKDGKIDWNDRVKFYHFIGFVIGVSYILGIKVRSGGDWNMNLNLGDQKFFDLPHYEVIDE